VIENEHKITDEKIEVKVSNDESIKEEEKKD